MDTSQVPAGHLSSRARWEICARKSSGKGAVRAGRLIHLGAIYTTPGFTDERIHLFLALEVTPGTQALDADEFVEPVVLTLSDALDRVRSGEIVDAKTICTLHLAAEWLGARRV